MRNSGIGAKIEFQIIEYVFTELALNKLRATAIYVQRTINIIGK